MAASLNSQLDFIFFFYGLAFILLGATCVAVRGRARGQAWIALGLFGFIHGAAEWLDLTALVVGDSPSFAMARTATLTASFMCLLEFARQEGIGSGLKLPGRWVHIVVLTAAVLGGVAYGVSGANVLARYLCGFVGAMGAGLIFARRAGGLSGAARRLSISAAVAFVFYGIAAGAIVPVAPFWPASVVNHDWFVQTTGVPIQLIRGLIACWIAYSVWAIWSTQLIAQEQSEAYSEYLRRQFAWTLAAMATILVCGWILTEVLGGIYRQNVQREASGDIDLLASRLTGETATVKGMVKALAGSRSVRGLLLGDGGESRERAQSLLRLDADAAGATNGYILNRDGAVMAASPAQAPDAAAGLNFARFPFFRSALEGGPGYQFAFDASSRTPDFFASYPVRDTAGDVIGVAVLKRSLDAFETDLRQFDRPYFLVDPDGVVVLTNQPGMLRRSLWTLSAERRAARTGEGAADASDAAPLLTQETVDATWITIGGARDFLRRRYAEQSRWSLVMLKPTQEIFASRVLGIVITLLMTIMALIYLAGRERAVHDAVQLGKRVKLQELARDLRFQANTDSLTGLYNRLRFNQALAAEMLRSARYNVPFSVIMFDVDRFKQINDTYGHQTGDRVLVQLARAASERLRGADVLARWGGEEFIILAPETDGAMALQAAEKLRAAIARTPFDGIGSVTCSFGLAQYANGESAESLIARADRALYGAKLTGRNRVEFAAWNSEAGMASVA
jgi:diguanylate cyclase (GGDEF)-like protein